jgi:hypothetical protein
VDNTVWLKREIKDGLQALVAMGLENQPAADVLPLTADIWLRAIRRGNIGCDIEQIDAPRIREAFDRLFPELVKWPAPKLLLDRIPPRPKREALAEPVGDDAVGQAAIKEILELLKAGFTADSQGGK